MPPIAWSRTTSGGTGCAASSVLSSVRPLPDSSGPASSTADAERAPTSCCSTNSGGRSASTSRFKGFEYTLQNYERARVANASITSIPFPDAVFDVATAFDVLYSLTEEQESAAVSEIYRVVKPGGTLIVNVAALSILRGNHSVFGQEVRRSTRRRLRRVLSTAGFEVARLTYTNASLFPLMLAVRTAQRLMGLATPEEAGTDLVVPPALVNAALTQLLLLEARALRVVDMPIGSSLLAVARKPVRRS